MKIFDRELLLLRKSAFAGLNPRLSKILEQIYLSILERFNSGMHFFSVLNIGSYGIDIIDLMNRCNLNTRNMTNIDITINTINQLKGTNLVMDFENLQFAENSFDLVISLGNIHSINNIEKFLSDIKKILTKNGVFIATFAGGNTLFELRKSLMIAEENTGIFTRIFPFIDVKDAGRLLQNAGFDFAISESETMEIRYKNIYTLFCDLKELIETNILYNSVVPLSKKVFNKAISYYKENFFDKKLNCYNVTINLITITGNK